MNRMALIKVFFLLATACALAQSSSPGSYYFYSFITRHVIYDLDMGWKMCRNNSIIIEEKYDEVFKTARKCYGEFIHGNQSICHNFEFNMQRCAQPIVDFFVDCFPEKSKSLPPAVLKAAESVAETFCTSSGEILLEAMNPCIYEFLDQHNKTIKAECKQEFFKSKVDKIRKELPSLSELCEFGREIRGCWQEYVNLDCENLKARELFSKFFDAVLSACNEI